MQGVPEKRFSILWKLNENSYGDLGCQILVFCFSWFEGSLNSWFSLVFLRGVQELNMLVIYDFNVWFYCRDVTTPWSSVQVVDSLDSGLMETSTRGGHSGARHLTILHWPLHLTSVSTVLSAGPLYPQPEHPVTTQHWLNSANSGGNTLKSIKSSMLNVV